MCTDIFPGVLFTTQQVYTNYGYAFMIYGESDSWAVQFERDVDFLKKFCILWRENLF